MQSVFDQVGSLWLVIDSSGEVQRRIDYDAFGYVTGDTNQTLDVPFGFAGGLYDPETRLCRFGYRDYDTETGRWTAKDPIFFAGGDTNLYGYCVGDPVNLIDPIGLKCKDSYWKRVKDNFKTTNEAIPGLLAPSLIPGVGVGVVTSGKMAESLGTTTLFRWAKSGFRGITSGAATFTGVETGDH